MDFQIICLEYSTCHPSCWLIFISLGRSSHLYVRRLWTRDFPGHLQQNFYAHLQCQMSRNAKEWWLPARCLSPFLGLVYLSLWTVEPVSLLWLIRCMVGQKSIFLLPCFPGSTHCRCLSVLMHLNNTCLWFFLNYSWNPPSCTGTCSSTISEPVLPSIKAFRKGRGRLLHRMLLGVNANWTQN